METATLSERSQAVPYQVEKQINGEWVVVTIQNWLLAQRITDKLQNRLGFTNARMVRVEK